MTDELFEAYKAIFLKSLRGVISREERDAQIVALRPMAAGLSHKQRDAIANKAVEAAAEIIDEVYFSPSGGKWQ
jgi:hypothetical protein